MTDTLPRTRAIVALASIALATTTVKLERK
jgi:hypothetical protein